MKRLLTLLVFCILTLPILAQDPGAWLATLPQAKDYVQHRVSSYDRSGGNADARQIAVGDTLTLLDEAGPGLITHVWVTIASDDPHHLKALVLRMYWDGESSPSVETPIGDFFGLGLGDYHLYQSAALAVGGDKALNCFFPMPFAKHARITVTNEGSQKRTRFISTLITGLIARLYRGMRFIFMRSIGRRRRPRDGRMTGSRMGIGWWTGRRI